MSGMAASEAEENEFTLAGKIGLWYGDVRMTFTAMEHGYGA